MTDHDRRFAAVAVAGMFLTGSLFQVLATMAHVFGGYGADWEASGAGAKATAAFVVTGLSVSFLLVVAASTFAVFRPGATRRRRAAQAVLSVVLVGGPLFLVNAFLLGPFSPVPLPLPWHLQLPATLGAVVLPGIAVGWWLARTRAEAIPWTTGLNVLLVGALLGGLLVGTAVGVPVEERAVETGAAFAPQAAFDAAYQPTGDRTGVLNVTHTGGAAIPVDHLVVHIEGAADVPNATQTESGPWAGQTTRNDGEQVVRPGDSVALGVERNCTVQLRYRQNGDVTVLDRITCEAARGK